MSDLFLNIFYTCDKKTHKQIINCEHWNFKESTCEINCKLKNINPSIIDCIKCKERKKFDATPNIKSSVSQVTISAPKKVNSQNVRSYAKAEVSQFTQGKVSEKIFNKRKEHCMSCERRKNPHPEGESIGWCTSCGCGITPRAALSQKLYIPTISCPLNKFGPEKGEGFNAKDAIDSVKGIATSVKSLFEKDK